MKPFNLEEAINGKAFYLENGYRGVIKYCVDDFITQFEQPPSYPYIGYVLDDKGFLFTAHTAWNENGKSNEYPSFNATTMVDDTTQQDKGQTMKPFNLEEALTGKPVKLRNGSKAYVLADVRRLFKTSISNHCLAGIVSTDNDTDRYSGKINWRPNGEYYDRLNESDYDIIGMWEEPKKPTSIEDLPKAFKPKNGNKYYYINECGIQFVTCYNNDDNFDFSNAKNARCYRTKQDAKKWLDFMKSHMEN